MLSLALNWKFAKQFQNKYGGIKEDFSGKSSPEHHCGRSKLPTVVSILHVKDYKIVSIKNKKKSSAYGRNSQSSHFCQNCWEIKEPPSLQCKQRSSPWQSSLSITSHPVIQPTKQTQQNPAYFAKPCPMWRRRGCQNSFERCLICQTWRSRGG